MHQKTITKKRGFTLVETLVGAAVFVLIATAAYQVYASLFNLIAQNQYKVNGLNLANEQFEIARNLPYADVGIVGGIPKGKLVHLQTVTRANIPFLVTTTVRNIDLAFDGTIGGTPNDLSPADNRLVEIEVSCPTCKTFTPITLTTNVAPKGLETASTNGALFIKVFDSNGIAVSDANVHVVNTTVVPNITIDDVTDNNGMLQIVDAPPGNEAYQITVTKPGYSTDRTYTTGAVGNPNPTKPHATVLLQQLTQISFSIDRLSTLSVKSVSPECVAVGFMDFSIAGSKVIGVNVPKYGATVTTDSSGNYSNAAIEGDYYTITNSDLDYDIVGINPLNPVSINPNSTQQVSLIVMPKNPKSLMITVKDNATKLPITGALVRVTKAGYDQSQITGRGALLQTNWSGGAGQVDFADNNEYFYNNGNVDINNPAGDIKLTNDGFGSYNNNGVLESSTFDTGSASNFYNFTWNPTDQPPTAGPDSVRFQFASHASTTSTTTLWTYKGPDGSTTTYYTSSNSPISSVHNGDRYARYKVYLSTNSSTTTPNISDTSFTMTSQCTPPGQVVFSGLAAGTYHVDISMAGYTTKSLDIAVNGAWQESEVLMSP